MQVKTTEIMKQFVSLLLRNTAYSVNEIDKCHNVLLM